MSQSEYDRQIAEAERMRRLMDPTRDWSIPTGAVPGMEERPWLGQAPVPDKTRSYAPVFTREGFGQKGPTTQRPGPARYRSVPGTGEDIRGARISNAARQSARSGATPGRLELAARLICGIGAAGAAARKAFMAHIRSLLAAESEQQDVRETGQPRPSLFQQKAGPAPLTREERQCCPSPRM